MLIKPPMQKPQGDKIRINNDIRTRQVRVVDEEGEQLGIMTPYDALLEAQARELDLVEVAPKANPPVCRIMDYGKYKYEQKRRARESRKHQHTVTVKEIKYRPKIDKHDFDYKTNHVREFIGEGAKVKVTIMFRGREAAHPEFGKDILKKVVEATEDIAKCESDPRTWRMEGRNMSIVLSPLKAAVPTKPEKSGGKGANSDTAAKPKRAPKPAEKVETAAPAAEVAAAAQPEPVSAASE